MIWQWKTGLRNMTFFRDVTGVISPTGVVTQELLHRSWLLGDLIASELIWDSHQNVPKTWLGWSTQQTERTVIDEYQWERGILDDKLNRSINRGWFLYIGGALKEASKWLITLTSNINHDMSLKKSTSYWILLGYSYVWALHNLHTRYPIYNYICLYPIYKAYSRWLKTHSLPFQSRVKSPRSRMQDPSWPQPGRGTQALPGYHGRIWHLNWGFTIGKWRF